MKSLLFKDWEIRAIREGRADMTRRLMNPQPIENESRKIGGISPVMGEDPNLFVTWLDRTDDGKSSIEYDYNPQKWKCPYRIGETVYAKEVWAPFEAIFSNGKPAGIYYRADGEPVPGAWKDVKWKSPLFLKETDARLFLIITDIKVERACQISEEDAIREGVIPVEKKPWWQGYRYLGDELIHQQYRGDNPPDWLIEPKKMSDFDPCAVTAISEFKIAWHEINGPDAWEKYVWVYTFEVKE